MTSRKLVAYLGLDPKVRQSVAGELDVASGAHAIVGRAGRARKAGRRLVLLRGPANVEPMLTLAGCCRDLEIGDIGPVESAVAAPLQFADEEAVL